MILKISERSVREIERRAFAKLRRHPALKDFWREWSGRGINEAGLEGPLSWTLSRAEVAAVYALARTPEERQVVEKLLALARHGDHPDPDEWRG